VSRTKISEGDGDPRHGTVNGYSNLGCRCPECRQAWTEYHYDYMHADEKRLENHRIRQNRKYHATHPNARRLAPDPDAET
jgi:hypothetical protein